MAAAVAVTAAMDGAAAAGQQPVVRSASGDEEHGSGSASPNAPRAAEAPPGAQAAGRPAGGASRAGAAAAPHDATGSPSGAESTGVLLTQAGARDPEALAAALRASHVRGWQAMLSACVRALAWAWVFVWKGERRSTQPCFQPSSVGTRPPKPTQPPTQPTPG
jgi:hypothetical protein